MDTFKITDDMLLAENLALKRALRKPNKKLETILNYIKTSDEDLCKYMWAATIVAVILDCDFRDSRQTLDEWYLKNK